MSTEQQLTGKPLRVLLVEDNADDAFLLERYLRRAGYLPQITRVETADAMTMAMQQVEQQNSCWDVILADYSLPTFSAPEALRLLKSSLYDVPFIMMSGAISEETAVAAMRAGAHDYISKQNLARLVPAIEREIKEAEERRRKRTIERALRSSEERFHRLIEVMPLTLLMLDVKGRVIYANEGIERLLGYSKLEIQSGSVTLEKIFVTSGNTVESLLLQWSSGERGTYEVECLRRDGASVPMLLGVAILNPEAPPHDHQIAAFLVDLTEQKRSHEVLRKTEKLAAAGRLAASVAHEINNPLEAVTNCLYLLSQCPLDEEAQEYLKLAQHELDRVTHITTQTLRFYRQSSRPIETNVHDLLETVLALYDMRLRSQGIKIVRQFGKIPSILARDGEVRQVLANLIGNAIDAMNGDGGRLLLRTRQTRQWSTGRSGIAVTVADTGPGMNEETLPHIFEPFFSTKGLTGTGLGLWISKEILTKHQGFIQVHTQQQQPQGTVFRLFLPLASEKLMEHDTPELRASA